MQTDDRDEVLKGEELTSDIPESAAAGDEDASELEEDSSSSDAESSGDCMSYIDDSEEQFLLEAADTDTSDEEEIRNTVGNIPLEWYDELAHLGYDIEGKRIPKPLSAGGDEV